MSNPPNTKMIPVYIDEAVFRVFKVYSAETDQSIQDIVKSLADDFSKGALQLATTIQNMRAIALAEKLKKEEEQRLADESPLRVPGHEVSPLGPTIEQPITV